MIGAKHFFANGEGAQQQRLSFLRFVLREINFGERIGSEREIGRVFAGEFGLNFESGRIEFRGVAMLTLQFVKIGDAIERLGVKRGGFALILLQKLE